MPATPGLTRESLIETYVADIIAIEKAGADAPAIDRDYILDLVRQVARVVDGGSPTPNGAFGAG